jgi:hypothetical protein
MSVNQLRWADRPCTAISLLALLLGAPTNAFSLLRRSRPPMLYSGAKGTMTPNKRLQRMALPRRR